MRASTLRHAALAVALVGVTGCASQSFHVAPSDGGASADAAVDAPSGAEVDAEAGMKATVLASDKFDRTTAKGFGMADVGGNWTVLGLVDPYTVDGSHAAISNVPGQGRGALLGDFTTDDADEQVSFVVAKTPSSGAVYIDLEARRLDSSLAYRGRVAVRSDGSASAVIYRRYQSVESDVTLGKSLDFIVTPGQSVRARFVVSGVNPSHLRLKAWREGTPEPAAWFLEKDDTSPLLQAKGTVGLNLFLSGTADAGIPALFDNLLVRRASEVP